MSESKMALARLPPLSGGKINNISPQSLRRLEALNGPTYRLNGKLHPLPPPKALKPYVDTKAGTMDTWPAHASGQTLTGTSAMLSKNKSLVLVSDEDSGKAPIIPKPRFLEQLENFLKKELRALGVVDIEPSDLRLQAHREVFEYLIEDFKTYKPLLSAIKNEYEMMLAHQRQQIRHLEPLKQMLVTVSEQCEQKIMALREDERGEMSDLKKENRDLYNKISSLMNEQKDLQEQVARLQTKLEEEYFKYREECDARKLLVADINDLRYQQEDYVASKNAAQNNQDTEEDPAILKIALQKSREAEKSATHRLNEMIANYGDVIPRRDYESLEAKHKILEEKHAEAEKQVAQLSAEISAHVAVQQEITKKRDEFYVELETLKRSSTPRPSWEKCADYVQGGVVRWTELSEGKRSSELVDVLLGEIQTGGFVDSAGADYFEPRGVEDGVPEYLKTDEQIRNRRLGKRDTALLVRDIWREKSAKDAERTDGKRENMADFLFEYLTKRFSLKQMVLEWGYNLHDACQRYAHDDIIGLFWKVLNNEADEEIFHSQLVAIHSLMTQMAKLDADNGNSGILSRNDFKAVLLQAYPAMDEDTTLTILHAADLELEVKDGLDEIDYKSLFTEDDEGNTGPFLDEVKKFMASQKEAYIKDIKEGLGNVSMVAVDDLMRAVTLVDPEINNDTMQQYMAWAFNTDVDGLKDVDPTPQEAVLERLSNGNITRVGAKM